MELGWLKGPSLWESFGTPRSSRNVAGRVRTTAVAMRSGPPAPPDRQLGWEGAAQTAAYLSLTAAALPFSHGRPQLPDDDSWPVWAYTRSLRDKALAAE